jgi:hypothetical protein
MLELKRDQSKRVSLKTMATPLPKKNNVRFAADLCVYHEGAVLDMECVREDDVWYQMDEMKYIKHQALKMSHGHNSIYLGSLLANTYGRCNSNVVDAINTWVTSCESLRGLERFVNKNFGETRTCARRRTIQVVLTAQHKMCRDGAKENENVERVLGRLSEAFSQDCVRFAAILGQADMVAVSSIYETYGVDNSEFTDCQKIPSKKLFSHDALVKTPSGKIRSTKETSPVTVSRSTFPLASKISPSKTQRDFNEMRFCF